jgi:hypothetical protein
VLAAVVLGLRPGESKSLKYHRAAEYQSTATTVSMVPPATGSAQPGSRLERTSPTFATNAP